MSDGRECLTLQQTAPLTVIVHTRNEEANIAACLESVAGWAAELLVMDMESADRTVEIARRYTDRIFSHPVVRDFDAARNVSASHAQYDWILFLDADERMTPSLAERIGLFIGQAPPEVVAARLPYKNFFLGKWIEHAGRWYPGYKAPTLLRKGRFTWGPYAHQGAFVEGQMVQFPADDPEYAVIHHAYPDLRSYVEKLNRYTEGEAAKFTETGLACTWECIADEMGRTFRAYLDDTAGYKDGPQGFILSVCSSLYEIVARLKHAETRLRQGWSGQELVPPSAADFLRRALVEAEKAARRPTGADEKMRLAPGKDAGASSAVSFPQVIWRAPIFDPSGYADEARQFVLGLNTFGVRVQLESLAWSHSKADLPLREVETLQRLTATRLRPSDGPIVAVSHIFPPHFRRVDGATWQVGRTMFETDRLPPDWVPRCNEMDEIWVPSEFNRESFAAAGVARDKIVMIPGGIDPRPFRFDAPPLSIEGRRAFNFLSVFDWSRRKGWDVLLRAFVEEFHQDEDVALILKVWSSFGWPLDRCRQQAIEELRGAGLTGALPTNIIFLEANLPTARMGELYRSADAFVLPTRGEGWGRPFMEAMLMGLPVIATRWSGHLEFMDDETAFLLDCRVAQVDEAACREVPYFSGHRWADPSREHLRSLMRQVVTDRDEGLARGLAGRARVLGDYTRQHVAGRVMNRLQEIADRCAPQSVHGMPVRPEVNGGRRADRPLRITWEGAQLAHHSLALVNRELCARLIETGHELSLILHQPDEFNPDGDAHYQAIRKREGASLSGPTDIHLRHHWPPNFSPPAEGHWVMIQPWEYGSLPVSWISPMRDQVDEVWAYTTFVRDCYLRSGVPADRVAVVPCGVDCLRYTPESPPLQLVPQGSDGVAKPLGALTFKFLFVGGTILRKGIDLLLLAYLRAFTHADDVALVIKDIGTQTFYRGQNWESDIRRIQNTPGAPAILYTAEDLAPEKLPGLYTACDCLVHPYRGEGFGLPIAEAMASGLPVIVTGYGAALDFCDPETAYLIPATEKHGTERRAGDLETVEPPWHAEANLDALIGLLRHAYQHREEGRAMGRRAANRIRAQFTWEQATKTAEARLLALRDRPVQRSASRQLRSQMRAIDSEVARVLALARSA